MYDLTGRNLRHHTVGAAPSHFTFFLHMLCMRWLEKEKRAQRIQLSQRAHTSDIDRYAVLDSLDKRGEGLIHEPDLAGPCTAGGRAWRVHHSGGSGGHITA